MENNFSTRIKELRDSLDLTQSQFATFIGTTQAALSSYEKGDRIPSCEILLTISDTFEVSVDWLLGLTESKFVGIVTYSDAFRKLLELCSTTYKDGKTEIISPTFKNGKNETHFVVSNDANFYEFFGQYSKVRELYINKTIDVDLYNLWIEKELKKYNFPLDRTNSVLNKG